MSDNHLDNQRFGQAIVRDPRHNGLADDRLGNRLLDRAQLGWGRREHGHVRLALSHFHRDRGAHVRHVLIHIKGTAAAKEVRRDHRLKVVACQGPGLVATATLRGCLVRLLWLVMVVVVVNGGHLQLKTNKFRVGESEHKYYCLCTCGWLYYLELHSTI